MIEDLRRFCTNVWAVAYKESVVLRHDHAFLGVAFIQPITMMLLFGVALSNVPRNVPWAVLDRSQTALSRRFVEEIRTSGYFRAPTTVASYDAARARLGRGDAVAVVVIPADFARDSARGRGTVQVLLDGADPLTAARIGGYVAQIGAAFDPGTDLVRTAAGPRGPGTITIRQRFWFNATLRDRVFFLSGLAAMLLTNLCLSATALAMVGERENGTYEQMLALPTRPVEIVLGKLLPYVAVSYVELLIALIPCGVIFGIWPQGSWILLFVISLPFILASLAIGTFVSTIARTSAQSVFLSVFFILPSFVLSGVTMPYQLMPDFVRHVGGLLPLRWYQIALRRVFVRGAGLGDVLVPMLVLTAMFLVLLAVIARRLKPRLA